MWYLSPPPQDFVHSLHADQGPKLQSASWEAHVEGGAHCAVDCVGPTQVRPPLLACTRILRILSFRPWHEQGPHSTHADHWQATGAAAPPQGCKPQGFVSFCEPTQASAPAS